VDGGGEVDEFVLCGHHPHNILVTEHVLLKFQMVDALKYENSFQRNVSVLMEIYK
jgi:hypothetical protein